MNRPRQRRSCRGARRDRLVDARGFTEAQFVETLLLLLTAGGDCPEDLSLFKDDPCLRRGLGYALPKVSAVRAFLDRFHDQELANLRPDREEQKSFILPSSNGIRALQEVQAGLVGRVAKLYAEQQRAMGGAVLAGDAADLHGVGVGVVEPADQVVDRWAAGVHQQQHRVTVLGIGPHPVDPLLAGAIEIGQAAGLEPEGLKAAAGQAEQADADARLMFQLVGGAVGIGADDATTGAAEPVARRNRLAQQRQQPLGPQPTRR